MQLLLPKLISIVISTVVLMPSLMVLNIATPAISQSKQEIDVSQILIGSLKLGMTTTEVRQLMGKPQKTKLTGICGEEKNLTIWNYPKLELGFTNNQLEYITSSNAKYITSDGITIGDTSKKVQQIYGDRRSAHSKNSLIYPNSSQGGLTFQIRSGKVAEIRMIASAC
jgi:hypothetical protein